MGQTVLIIMSFDLANLSQQCKIHFDNSPFTLLNQQ